MKKVWIIVFGLSYLGVSAQKKWSLKECVSYAVEHNLQVIQNQYTKQSQEYNLKMAKKEYLPSVSGNMTNGVSFGQASLGTGSIRNDRFNNSVSIMADMMIYNNGRIEKTVRKAQFDVEASQYDIETIKNDISLQIAQQYLTALLNKEIVKISQSAVENAKKQADRAKITTQVGTTAQTVLAEAEAALAREKQNLKTAEVNVGRALFAIAQLLQLTDYKDFDVEDVNVPETLDSQLTTADEVLKTAYEIQPQIKAAESRIRAAEAQTEVNKTSFWPSLSASAGLSTFYNNLLNNSNLGGQQNSFFQQYDDNFGQNVGLSLRIPIFNKGITKLQVEQSRLNESVAKNTLEQQKQTVRQNVQKAQFDADANYENYLAAVEAEKSSKLALDFADKSYAAGRTTIYDVNVARNNYANAQGSVAQAKYNYLFSLKLLNFYAGIPLSL
ncbi:TolC family protein [Chryseobacterium arthrosphaerae]|uniref:TolC family protein n=1 Tax=Chryseobacterium arthrosphaerae TaxID=651561 RepID=A0A1B8ZI30_9FLAO|nr:TolC family protein [Chryseobacterium arthrosphaerae]MDG4651534.1 TolC family protein [Chryseobacterium arthrosphaerae]OCA71275.1 transporter [Chryseobacterium arthrosphaerae]RTZ50343.1 TolC family protein [Chryseobacterium arthrosphaerae]UEQ75155.1 TolC family protein [Chryseobacterium arthrosphaerae]